MPPRRQRKRLTARKRSKSAPAVLRSPRKVKRKKWTDEQMEGAMKAVESGLGVNRAAVDYGVPWTTLKDRLSSRVEHGRKPGLAPYLTAGEEKELGEFLKSCASIGYAKTRKDVMHIVQSVVTEKGILRKDRISQGWWHHFRRN